MDDQYSNKTEYQHSPALSEAQMQYEELKLKAKPKILTDTITDLCENIGSIRLLRHFFSGRLSSAGINNKSKSHGRRTSSNSIFSPTSPMEILKSGNDDIDDASAVFQSLVNEILQNSIQSTDQYQGAAEPPQNSFKDRKYRIGVCAMEVKARSKAMSEILERLRSYGIFEIIHFNNHLILEESVDAWPQVDMLIAFYSTRFPLDKAIQYQNKYTDMVCVNDLVSQKYLLDRRSFYRILENLGAPTVEHFVLDRSDPQTVWVEEEDCLIVNGKKMEKPFVEKPVDAEDHDINIYYHSSQGGGVRKLFRKIGNSSSKYYPDEHNIRTEGNYIYEKFVEVKNGQDVKVYAVGTNYALAELRKSPTRDGKVERNAEGFEIRKNTKLTQEESETVSKIVAAFKQNVCGIDILRTDDKFYVCDVNGWSAVKGNSKYYDDCAEILKKLFLSHNNSVRDRIRYNRSHRKLIGMVAIFRHGDRTPKQKVKIEISTRKILDFFYLKPKKSIKIKNDTEQARLNKFAFLLRSLLRQDHIHGISESKIKDLQLVCTVLESNLPGTKLQIKPTKTDDFHVSEVLLICKWGGVLSHSGVIQARELGKSFANYIPKYTKEENIELFANNERRVHRTAEEFAKGFLGMPILPSGLVTLPPLFNISEFSKERIDQMKRRLKELLHLDYVPSHFPGEWTRVGNPLQTLEWIYEALNNLVTELDERLPELSKDNPLCSGESFDACYLRWKRLRDGFFKKEPKEFDTTKIPDLFDYIKYDLTHNYNLFSCLKTVNIEKIYEKSSLLSDLVIPLEYGIEPEHKLDIAGTICQPLVRDIVDNINSIVEGSLIRHRFYFTSESFVHTVLHTLLYSGLPGIKRYKAGIELSYLTQIVFNIYKYGDCEPEDTYKIVISFSNGCALSPFDENSVETREQHMLGIKKSETLNTGFSLDQLKLLLGSFAPIRFPQQN